MRGRHARRATPPYATSRRPTRATSPGDVEHVTGFQQGQGGALVPLMCVDKTPQELPSFAALVTEAQQFTAPGHDWVMVFAAAMSGTLNQAPTSADAEAPLQRMVDAIKRGAIEAFIPFDRQGHPVRLG